MKREEGRKQSKLSRRQRETQGRGGGAGREGGQSARHIWTKKMTMAVEQRACENNIQTDRQTDRKKRETAKRRRVDRKTK